MPRHPVELAKKHYEELPAVLKQALFSTEIAEQMFEIGKKFGLTIEKTGIMAEETGYVMLGLARPNELVGNLAAELGVDSDKAQDIAAEISHQIFFPLREELKRTHDFDMDTDSPRWSSGEAGEVVGSGGATRVSGMELPPSVKKTLVEEKSPLVSDLTLVRESPVLPIPQKTPTVVIPAKAGIQEAEQKTGFPIKSGMTETLQLKPAPASPPSFQPPASPTGRIDDLRKMVEKPSLPRPAPELFTSPSRKITDLRTTLEKKEGGVEPWEKDLEKEVSSLLKPSPIDLRPLQKSTVPPPSMQTKLPPIDLRPAPPSVPRMTPQLQDLARETSAQEISKNLPGNEIGPTLLQEKMRTESQGKVSPPESVSPPSTPTVPSERAVGVPTPKGVGTSSDPYREPVEETNV